MKDLKSQQCDECGKSNEMVALTIIETKEGIKKMWLCEKCYEKYEKPFKRKKK